MLLVLTIAISQLLPLYFTVTDTMLGLQAQTVTEETTSFTTVQSLRRDLAATLTTGQILKDLLSALRDTTSKMAPSILEDLLVLFELIPLFTTFN